MDTASCRRGHPILANAKASVPFLIILAATIVIMMNEKIQLSMSLVPSRTSSTRGNRGVRSVDNMRKELVLTPSLGRPDNFARHVSVRSLFDGVRPSERFSGGSCSHDRTLPYTASSRKARERGKWIAKAGRDFYNILGVDRGADLRTIKNAYRKLTKKYHPDVNKAPDADEKYKEINAAYDVLKDDEKRQIYDRFGEEGLQMGGPGGPGGMDGFGGSPFGDIFESFFTGGSPGGFGGGAVNLEDLFGGGMGGGGTTSERRTTRGENKMATLNVDFMDAVFGTNKEFEVSRYETCGTCDGSGAKPGTTPRTCTTCGGKGQVISIMRTPLGQLQQVQTCPDCEGTGQTFEKCETCFGEGRTRGSRKISLRIPPGIDSGQRLRVRGEGDAGLRGGAKGDLFVQISVKPHPEFRREGNTIHSDAKISYIDAILGKQIKVKTVDGLVDMKVPKGTQPETTLVMRNRGIPTLGNSDQRGDHHVHVKVIIPKEISEEEQKLIEEVRKLKEEKA